MEIKQCPYCKERKPITEFARSRVKRRTGEVVFYECKACVRDRALRIKLRELSADELQKQIRKDSRVLRIKYEILIEKLAEEENRNGIQSKKGK